MEKKRDTLPELKQVKSPQPTTPIKEIEEKDFSMRRSCSPFTIFPKKRYVTKLMGDDENDRRFRNAGGYLP